MSQQTLMFVSKTHIQTVKRLYKIIFQLHKSLPTELKQIGDSYVRSEFKLHKNASPDHVKQFMNEWANYAQTLMRQVNPKFRLKLGENIGAEKLDSFNDSQISQLYELFLETTKNKRLDSESK